MTEQLDTLLETARAHATATAKDVAQASTRAEAIRLSVRAAEAARLVSDLETLARTYGQTVAYFSMHASQG
jgi:oligoendopeptidase F